MTPPPPKDDDDHSLLVRIDERLKVLSKDIEELKRALESNYVTKAEFAPVRKLVYGAVAVSLVSVASGILALVIKVS